MMLESWISVVTLVPFKFIRSILFELATSKKASLHKANGNLNCHCRALYAANDCGSPGLSTDLKLQLSIDRATHCKNCQQAPLQTSLAVGHLHCTSEGDILQQIKNLGWWAVSADPKLLSASAFITCKIASFPLRLIISVLNKLQN